MRDRLRAALAADPVAIPALGVLVLLIAWATDQDGYPQTHWAPGGLIVTALLAIAIAAVGLRRARTPRPVLIAIAALAAYTAFSFLSILWAKVPGDAWEGADRTLVYLAVFALLATWRRPGGSAAVLLGAWTLAMAGLALYTVLHVNAAAGNAAQIETLMPGGALIYPAGYKNADAAMWMMAAFPALILASGRRVPWALRGLLAGGCVVLACVALYSQSRGAVYSTPIVLALVFLLAPGRVRTFATLVPVAAGVAAAVPEALRLDERVELRSGVAAAAHSATVAVLVAAAVVALAVALGALLESRRPFAAATGARVHRAVAALGALTLVAVIVGGAIAVGNPIARVEREWKTLTSTKGYGADVAGGSWINSGLGSTRWDFYRVGWHEFADHPLLGIGADNFAVPYLRLRRTAETPHYPHSVELRTLAQTGAIGALIALIGLIAALVAGRRALRAPDRLGRVVAAAALAGFVYWVVHGSFDWFFEYAGLGAAAFALLGLTCSLCPPDRGRAQVVAPRWSGSPPRSQGRGRPLRVAAALLGAVALALAAGASLTLPWLSRADVQSAGRIWPVAPESAYARLRQAADLNPLSDEPDVVAGSIALRLGQLRRADRLFGLALAREPEDAYATLERGAIASALGQRGRALTLMRRAVYLSPRDQLAQEALHTVRAGGRVDIVALNRSILREARHFP